MNATTNPAASKATATPDAERYLREVASHLAGLPAGDRAELLEDLAQHLEEIAAEPGPPLSERLGSPGATDTCQWPSCSLLPARRRRQRGCLLHARMAEVDAAVALRAGGRSDDVASQPLSAWCRSRSSSADFRSTPQR